MPTWTTFTATGRIFTFSPPTGTSGAFTIFFSMSDGNNQPQAQFSVVVTAATAN
jgi:hypothetical protein